MRYSQGRFGRMPPPTRQFQVCRYVLPDNASPEEVAALVSKAEEECTAEMRPKQKSAHDEIEEYRRQHGLTH